MGLHRLLGFTAAVPDPSALTAFYGELGLGGSPTTGFTGSDGGASVLVDEGDFRRLIRVEFGCQGPEDIDAAAARLTDGGAAPVVGDGELRVVDPASRVELVVRVADVAPTPAPASLVVPNTPGATVRADERAPACAGPRPPRRLGHLVIGTPALTETRDLLVQGLGLKLSDEIDGVIAFLRCSAGPPQRRTGRVTRPTPAALLVGVRRRRPRGPQRVGVVAARPEPSHLGAGPALRRLQLLLVLPRPGWLDLELYSDLDQILDDEAWELRGRTPFDFEHVANSWGPDLPLEFIVPARPRPAPGRVGRAVSATVPDRVDVVVVGAGPVGCALSLLLEARDRSVLVVERHVDPYPLPRAVHFDDETARILQACGLGEELPALSEPATTYEWRNGEGLPLLRFETPAQGRQGWPSANMSTSRTSRPGSRPGGGQRGPLPALGSRRRRCRSGRRWCLGRDRAG